MNARWQIDLPYHSPYDPCPMRGPKHFIIPINQFLIYQPRRLKQYAYREALRHGSLWPDLTSDYKGRNPYE
ncbi:MAG: hypothetical protein OWR52_01235 [Acidibacillus sp.]|nr:hypothetical protein [Acidibacillus sp.]